MGDKIKGSTYCILKCFNVLSLRRIFNKQDEEFGIKS